MCFNCEPDAETRAAGREAVKWTANHLRMLADVMERQAQTNSHFVSFPHETFLAHQVIRKLVDHWI